MTLVLACLTEKLLVIGADRRLTAPTGEVHDDYASKLIVFRGRAAVAYTGLSRIDGRPTDEWLAERLRHHTDLKSGFDAICAGATSALGRSNIADKRFAAVGVVWATLDRQLPARPMVVVASNFWSHAQVWLPEAGPRVVLTTHSLPHGRPHNFFVAGQPIYESEGKGLDVAARKCVKRGVGAMPFIRLVGNAILAFEHSNDPRSSSVGGGFQAMALDYDAVARRDTRIFLGCIPAGGHGFIDVERDATLRDRATSPLMVIDDRVVHVRFSRVGM